jgi:hypothetical protein
LIKCIADGDADIGSPLCCGQDGLVQKKVYNGQSVICPKGYKCKDYVCGQKWGHCVSDVQ